MRYAVPTTKHHEGFWLWDSALTEHKAARTLAGRDLVRSWAGALRAEGFRVGFYHSLLSLVANVRTKYRWKTMNNALLALTYAVAQWNSYLYALISVDSQNLFRL